MRLVCLALVAPLELREHLLHEGDELLLHLLGGELAWFIRRADTLDLTYGQRAGRADGDLTLGPDHGEADRSGGHHRVATACWRGRFDHQADLRRMPLRVDRPRLFLLDDLAVVVPLPQRILDLLHRGADDLVEETLHAAREL